MKTVFGTWLHVAATAGQLEIVNLLVGLGIDVNVRGGIADCGAIKSASSAGHIEVVRYLLSAGAEMDVSDPTRNPLFGAIYGGHIDVAKLLIESGIDTQIKYTGDRMKNMDALGFAREQGQNEIADLLSKC